MAPEEFEGDRRRLPRVAADADMECRLEVRTRVRLLDISASGMLLASEAALPVGTYAHIRAGVGDASFAPEVQVRRTVDRQREAGLGALFVGMDDRSRQSLEAFLRKASE